MAAFELDGIGLRFGPAMALEGIDLELREGECMAVMGPNGAGKTCLLGIMAGVISPTSGTIRGSATSSRRRLGYCPQAGATWDNLRVREQILLVASFYGIDDSMARRRCDGLVADFGLGPEARRLGRELSQGKRRTLALILSVMHDPPVLLLDEPEASLDESARGALLRFLEAEARRGDRTIVFSTHLTAESGRLADRVTHLDLGRIVRGSP